MDGTFAPAKKGGSVLARHEKVRGQSAWFWSTARVFLSECTFRLPVPGGVARRNDARAASDAQAAEANHR